MAIRWRVLVLLFMVRAAMGLQFQAIGALSPVVMDSFAVGLAEIGLLIGLYLSPGIVLALPGGALGARFGDKHVVVAGLVLMLAGAVLSAVAGAWEAQIAARLLAGIGGVLLNVLMSKMVQDWFTGREIATAMGIFINSWPFGIALALLILPWVEAMGGLGLALWSVAGLTAAGLMAMATLYRAPGGEGGSAPERTRLGRATLAVLIAGGLWGAYNGGLSMVFSFGPALLTEAGWSLADASGATSIVLWLAVLSVPTGGVIADWTGRRDLVLLVGALGFAAALWALPRVEEVWVVLLLLGVFGGLPAGPIMSLPAGVLSPGNRAVGMGLFFTVFYTCAVAAPWVAGWLAGRAGTTAIVFDFGAVLLIVVAFGLGLFHLAARATKAP